MQGTMQQVAFCGVWRGRQYRTVPVQYQETEERLHYRIYRTATSQLSKLSNLDLSQLIRELRRLRAVDGSERCSSVLHR